MPPHPASFIRKKFTKDMVIIMKNLRLLQILNFFKNFENKKIKILNIK